MNRTTMLVCSLVAGVLITSCGGDPYLGLSAPSPQNNSGNSRILPDGSVYIEDTDTSTGISRLLPDGSVYIETN